MKPIIPFLVGGAIALGVVALVPGVPAALRVGLALAPASQGLAPAQAAAGDGHGHKPGESHGGEAAPKAASA
ncbi:hypothetical protein ACFQY5_33375 [Paeniroseomonas aquatica]|uniref:hypothetical protein n=1 Tax=Paeniroseomonas aquatica TaxID=373043 RepID=UPI003620D778